MIKKTLLLILGFTILTSCKNQKEENKVIVTKSDNSKNSEELLEKDKDSKTLDLQDENSDEPPKESLFKCKENDNGVSIYDDPLNKTCVCNDSTFNKAYEIFYTESPDYIQRNLLKKLPQKNHEWKAVDADITYTWVLQDTLKIKMFFQGGENNYVFYKNSDNKMEYKEYLSLP
ncbi:hypothetical protein [Flavobacterium sp. 9]|uniref:hypothetical protein n=1 Tax=Flavobacterium sp. 9 TaxID=2035198 RepID=UPI000C19F767|nr:hypothetical protein [Flavobacterium sp. 9]